MAARVCVCVCGVRRVCVCACAYVSYCFFFDAHGDGSSGSTYTDICQDGNSRHWVPTVRTRDTISGSVLGLGVGSALFLARVFPPLWFRGRLGPPLFCGTWFRTCFLLAYAARRFRRNGATKWRDEKARRNGATKWRDKMARRNGATKWRDEMARRNGATKWRDEQNQVRQLYWKIEQN